MPGRVPLLDKGRIEHRKAPLHDRIRLRLDRTVTGGLKLYVRIGLCLVVLFHTYLMCYVIDPLMLLLLLPVLLRAGCLLMRWL